MKVGLMIEEDGRLQVHQICGDLMGGAQGTFVVEVEGLGGVEVLFQPTEDGRIKVRVLNALDEIFAVDDTGEVEEAFRN